MPSLFGINCLDAYHAQMKGHFLIQFDVDSVR